MSKKIIYHLLKYLEYTLAIFVGFLSMAWVIWMKDLTIDVLINCYKDHVGQMSMMIALPFFVSLFLNFFDESSVAPELRALKLVKIIQLFFLTLLGHAFLNFMLFDEPVHLFFIARLFQLSVYSTCFIYLIRLIFDFIYHMPFFRTKILVMGMDQEAIRFVEKYIDIKLKNSSVLGFIPLQDKKIKIDLMNNENQVIKVFNNTPDIKSLCRENDISLVIVSNVRGLSSDQVNHLYECRLNHIEVLDMLDFNETSFHKISVDLVGHESFHFDKQLKIEFGREFWVRLYNIIFSSIGLLIYGLFIFPLIAILMKITMPGPIFFSQIRIGLFGKKYRIYKLRSMIVEAEKDGAQWAKSKDIRITWLGKFLRSSRLDEFPQLWNVIKGDMNIVGPRPERPEFTKELEERIPYFKRRNLVRPGITGWAQVNLKYTNTVDDAKYKLEYDLYYVKHHSFIFDLYIFFRTFKPIMMMEGI